MGLNQNILYSRIKTCTLIPYTQVKRRNNDTLKRSTLKHIPIIPEKFGGTTPFQTHPAHKKSRLHTPSQKHKYWHADTLTPRFTPAKHQPQKRQKENIQQESFQATTQIKEDKNLITKGAQEETSELPHRNQK